MFQRTSFATGHLLPAALIALAALAALAGLATPAPAAAQTNPNFEYGIDRRGGDYRSFDLNFDAPALCAGQCAQEGQCRAWTYVKPGVQGPKARCWLKNVVPAPTRDGNVISGLRGSVPPPATPPVATSPPANARYVGCFKDTSVFDLNGHLERSAQNTPQRCVAICQARGFAYAGVQYGQSCLCGNSYGRYGAAAASACNLACTGDRGQACGGYNTNSIYATGTACTACTACTAAPAGRRLLGHLADLRRAARRRRQLARRLHAPWREQRLRCAVHARHRDRPGRADARTLGQHRHRQAHRVCRGADLDDRC